MFFSPRDIFKYQLVNACAMFSGYRRLQGIPTLIRTLFLGSFACVLFFCAASILLLNMHTTNNFQAYTTLYIRMDGNVLTAREANTSTVKPLQTLQLQQTTTFPSDILHNWNDTDKDTLAIYLLSAIGFNNYTDKALKADIRLTGWVAKWLRKAAVKCCILMKSGLIVQYKEHTTVVPKQFRENLNLTVHQYECHVTTRMEEIRGATIQYENVGCPQNTDRYITPFVPKKVNTEESFAICLKIVFGNVDNVKLKDWLEYNRAIGVDKVFMYTYNISQATRDVLRHYIKQGFVEKRPFAYPWNNTRHIGDKVLQVWEDEQAVVSDCHQRLSRYKYLAVLDLDEFLVPRKHNDVKKLMKTLMEAYPEAGGFELNSYIFDKHVPPDANTEHLPEFLRYFKRTRGLFGKHARQKNIVLPPRVTVNSYTTHRFMTKSEYQKIRLNTTLVTINHYRHCYSNLNETCSQLTSDTYIRKLYKIVRNNTEYRNASRQVL